MRVGLEFSPNDGFSSTSFFSGHISFMGMLIHSSFMHEDKNNLQG